MGQDENKRCAALAAIDFVEEGSVVGVGTGSTANHFIDALGDIRTAIRGAVASSNATEFRLRRAGVPVLDLNDTGPLPLYVDGADEATSERWLIKGGGGALTREKIVAQASSRFVCVVDETKLVRTLGAFPLPIEVIPLARALVDRQIRALGGDPRLRPGFVTDNGNQILDVTGLDLRDAPARESQLNQIPGVVTNGLFCRRPADVLLVGSSRGVTRYPAQRSGSARP